MVIGAGLGARLVYLCSHPFMWSEPSQWWRFWEGGMVSYGGLGGALLALAVFRRRRSLPVLPYLDLLSPALLAGWGVGRVGCFLTWYGEEGKPTSVPWGLQVDGALYHPVQLYLIGLLWVGSYVLSGRSSRVTGEGSALALAWYAGARALTDFFRTYEPHYLQALSQLTCLVLAVAALSWLNRILRRQDSERETWNPDSAIPPAMRHLGSPSAGDLT